MTTGTTQAEIYRDQEQNTAERYRWWGVYLIREKRRLQAIADAIAGRAEAVEGRETATTTQIPSPEASTGMPGETQGAVEERSIHTDTEPGMAEALPEADSAPREGDGESKTPGRTGRDGQTIPEDREQRKLLGRARLLGRHHDKYD
jgi:hypothetical protein